MEIQPIETIETKLGQRPKPTGNINDPQNIEDKRKTNNEFYRDRGCLINRIKRLVLKYDVDVLIDHKRKTRVELLQLIEFIRDWVINNRTNFLLC